MKKIPDKWFYLPILILGVYLIIRLIDQSQLLFYFPLDFTNDISSYMAQLFFLDSCGFHNFCEYWYGGFTTFQFTPPGWFVFTLPLLWLFGDVKVATYVSLVLMFLIGLGAFLSLGKLFRFSKIKRVAFFLFFFGNAIAIGNFIRLGDVHQLFAWVNFIIFAFIVLYYKERKINKHFYWIVLVLTIIILAHQTTAILSAFVLLGLFLVKRNKERVNVFLAGLISALITSFWWVPYMKGFWNTTGSRHILTKSLIKFDVLNLPQNVASFIIPFLFWFVFYYYWKTYGKSKKEVWFFMPVIFLSLVLFFRVVYLIPILKFVYPDAYLYLFLFFTIFMFFKLDIDLVKLKRLIPYVLVLVVLVSVGVNLTYTPDFALPNKTGENLLEIMKEVEGTFLVLGNEEAGVYSKALYSYGPIYHNLSTPGGWAYISNEEQLTELKEVWRNLQENQCEKVVRGLKKLETNYLISFEGYCEVLAKCDLVKKKQREKVCLYYVG